MIVAGLCGSSPTASESFATFCLAVYLSQPAEKTGVEGQRSGANQQQKNQSKQSRETNFSFRLRWEGRLYRAAPSATLTRDLQ